MKEPLMYDLIEWYHVPVVFLCAVVFSICVFIFVPKDGSKLAKTAGASATTATCTMNGFKGFPSKVSGPVALELKNVMSIIIVNKDKTEQVEIVFPKNKCKKD